MTAKGWLSALAFGESRLHGGEVDHRLKRRALIRDYRAGRVRRDQVCDAHPELIRAARHVGDETSVRCPICREDRVVLVSYVFGPRLPSHGRCVANRDEFDELVQRARRSGGDSYTAFVVEACRRCSWHHLLRSIPLAGRSQEAPARRRAGG